MNQPKRAWIQVLGEGEESPELLEAYKQFNIPPDQVIYIGDSRLDELAARTAGMPLVAYRNPDLSAAYYVNSLNEIEGLLGVGQNGN